MLRGLLLVVCTAVLIQAAAPAGPVVIQQNNMCLSSDTVSGSTTQIANLGACVESPKQIWTVVSDNTLQQAGMCLTIGGSAAAGFLFRCRGSADQVLPYDDTIRRFKTASSTWATGFSKGSYGAVDVGADKFNDWFRKSPRGIIKRLCANCVASHQEIYYKRLTNKATFAPYDYMKTTWSSNQNVLNRDFALYSTYADAVAGTNGWTRCNYDDRDIAFPRDCGPRGLVGATWSSERRGGQPNIAFYIELGSQCLSIGGQFNIAFLADCIDNSANQDFKLIPVINECLTNNGGCDGRSTCIDTLAYRTCGPCPAGFTGDGDTGCTDINECLTNNGGCDSRTTCTNADGGRSCGPCPLGYSGDGATGCRDINECLVKNGGCDPLSVCTNQEGSRLCGTCPQGFDGSGDIGCTDVNECTVNNGGCDRLTTCINTPGSRACGACPSGYQGNGVTGCTDANECALNNGGCDPLATCINSPGGRVCGPCPQGYLGNGATGCMDVNECITQNGGCDVQVLCTNTPGSRICGNCPFGWEGDGVKGCTQPNVHIESAAEMAARVGASEAAVQAARIHAIKVEQDVTTTRSEEDEMRKNRIEELTRRTAALGTFLNQEGRAREAAQAAAAVNQMARYELDAAQKEDSVVERARRETNDIYAAVLNPAQF